jgi:hypothetical protein
MSGPSHFHLIMPINFLAKKLFPREADWQRKKQFKTIFWVVIASVIFGVIVGGFMLFAAYKNSHG